MRKIAFIIPGDINLPTGGYRYDKAILECWKKSGIDCQLISLNGDYPFPTEDQKFDAMCKLPAMLSAEVAVIDGLAGGVLPELIEALSRHMPVISLLHHPLCLENGLDDEVAERLKDSELKGLQHISYIITTSPQTKRTVNKLFSIPSEKIKAVLPGVERNNFAVGSGSNKLNLLCVGSLIERKGHKFLVKALSQLAQYEWQLDCIGSLDFDPSIVEEVKCLIADQNLSGRIKLRGEVSKAEIDQYYHKADMFILPSLYEGYGMVYAEAIVRGLPVIGTTAGAIPDTVPQSCGILVEPSNINALAHAIERFLSNPELLAKFRKGAIAEEPHFPTWDESANSFYEILETCI